METLFLLPLWLRLFWIAIYTIVVIFHIHHAASKGGRSRTWHSIHMVMALGMVYMFLPRQLQMMSELVWETAFAILACVSFTIFSRVWLSYRTINVLWTLSLVDTVAMVYMFALPQASVASLNCAFILYFVGIMVAWLAGAFDDTDAHDRPLKHIVCAQFRFKRASIQSLDGTSSVELRTSLAAMAAGMSYMFRAMQVGM